MTDHRWEALGTKLVRSWPEVASNTSVAVGALYRRNGTPREVEIVSNRILASTVGDAAVLRHIVFEARATEEGYTLKTVPRTPMGQAWVRLLEEL